VILERRNSASTSSNPRARPRAIRLFDVVADGDTALETREMADLGEDGKRTSPACPRQL